jgi:alkyl hydroperoxide reductase subunit F
MNDLIIIGGGPAGVAAGVYAARKQLKTTLIAEVIGGQSTDSLDVQNWIGTKHISGVDLAKSLEEHLKEYAGDIVDLRIGERATKLEKIDPPVGETSGGFRVSTPVAAYEAKTVLIATGGMRRKLEVPGADIFEHKGVTYCASCDGPIFAGQDTVVIGAGNAGFETAAQLLAYAKSVTLLARSEYKADPVTIEKVMADPKMKGYTNVEPTEVIGEKFVKAIKFKNRETGEVTELPVGGIFVEIGMLPSTDFAKGVVELDELNRVVTDPKNQHTSVEGIWAAGDCTDELYHQNNIAAGDAVKALEDIYMFLKAR